MIKSLIGSFIEPYLTYIKMFAVAALFMVLAYLIWNYNHMQTVIVQKNARIGQLEIQIQVEKENAELEKAVLFEETISKVERKTALKAREVTKQKVEKAKVSYEKVKTYNRNWSISSTN